MINNGETIEKWNNNGETIEKWNNKWKAKQAGKVSDMNTLVDSL